MSEQEKIEELAEIFEIDAGGLTKDTSLDTLSWDSMAMLSVMALSKAHGIGMSAVQVREVKTIGDILPYL